MIGIIAAMDLELDLLKTYIQDAKTQMLSGICFMTGMISGQSVVTAVSGIGKVNAAVCAQSMILAFRPDCVINTGVGGALDKSLKLLDVVAASAAVQHDVDTTALGDAPGFVSTVKVIEFPTDPALTGALLAGVRNTGARAFSGKIATGDQFISKQEDKQRIRDLFGAAACEMEGGSIAQVCYINRVPCAILRAISDGADEDANMSYSAFASKAADISAHAILNWIGTL